jgi:CBS domain-containing protein
MRRTVQDVMTREVVAVRGPTPFKELVRLLNQHRITAVPVLDDAGRVVGVDHSGALIGIVTRADLLRVFLRSDDELRFDVLDHVSGDLLRLPAGTVEVEVDDGIVHLAGRVRLRSQALTLEKVSGLVDGVVAVDSRLAWRVDDVDVPPVPHEPAPLG